MPAFWRSPVSPAELVDVSTLHPGDAIALWRQGWRPVTFRGPTRTRQGSKVIVFDGDGLVIPPGALPSD